jgi:hypothetical protein
MDERMTRQRMVELLEIEKECVRRNACGECNRACHICDLLQDDTELHEMYEEVIALMKAQEPRVMTLEEWKNLPEPKDGECLCYEINDGSRLQAMLIKAFAGSEHLYGKAFRCWTSRPDEKMRRETPWDC